jgi:hypothetical protein
MLWHYPVGFLDEMFTVFDDHNHPVVLIGPQALCWMAVRLETQQVYFTSVESKLTLFLMFN